MIGLCLLVDHTAILYQCPIIVAAWLLPRDPGHLALGTLPLHWSHRSGNATNSIDQSTNWLLIQCLKLRVTQLLLATKYLARPVKFAPGPVNYDKSNKEGNFLFASGWLSDNFIFKHCWPMRHMTNCWVFLLTGGTTHKDRNVEKIHKNILIIFCCSSIMFQSVMAIYHWLRARLWKPS